MERIYYCIDMKSFFASVECAERGLDPFHTNLIVADETRGEGTICLAVSPKMKTLGVRNRCRVFEIPKTIEYIKAKPRMKKYIDYAAEIYAIYLEFIDKRDIHVYSIDECFIDATDYLKLYKKEPKQFAKHLTDLISQRLHIPSSVGIGTNLYLAKIALDIMAKRERDNMGYLDEECFKKELWSHTPITDFWGIARGISRRLERMGILDMEGIARYPQHLLYKEFGVNAELIIDHAWGRETCLMSDIKKYKTKSKSISSSQVLFYDYDFEKAKLVLEEMIRKGCLDMIKSKVVAGKVGIFIGYSKDVLAHCGAMTKLPFNTNLPSVILPVVIKLFESKVDRFTPIRRVGFCFDNISDEGWEGYDLFTDFEKAQKEKNIANAVLEIQTKFGKNAVVMAADLQEGATLMARNKMIGGHHGGDE